MARKAPLLPKNGTELQVLVIARISVCVSQKDVGLEDQIDHGKDLVAELNDGPTAYTEIATKGKGDRLSRPQLGMIEDLLRSGKFDVMVMDDIGRLVRGTQAVALWGIAVDHGTRCLALNDGLDTADANWESEVADATGVGLLREKL